VELARHTPSLAPDPNDVLDLLPDNKSLEKVTAKAIEYIPDAAAGVQDLIFGQRSITRPQFGPVLGSIIESNIETIAKS
jgi:hypothetical protein